MRAAAVVRIGAGHQPNPALALVHHQSLAVVGIEVEQGQVTAQRDLAGAERIRQPATVGIIAQPTATQVPQA